MCEIYNIPNIMTNTSKDLEERLISIFCAYRELKGKNAAFAMCQRHTFIAIGTCFSKEFQKNLKETGGSMTIDEFKLKGVEFCYGFELTNMGDIVLWR
jgi:hypothetical protein